MMKETRMSAISNSLGKDVQPADANGEGGIEKAQATDQAEDQGSSKKGKFSFTEVLVVRNGPVPQQTDLILDEYEATRETVRVLRLPEILKRGIARHTGFLDAKYDYVAIMDADDESREKRFELQAAAIIDRGVDIVGGQIMEFEDSSDQTRLRIVPLEHNAIMAFGRVRYPFNNVTLMFNKQKYVDLDYRQSRNFVEDYDLYAELVKAEWVFGNVEQVLVDVRAGAAQHARRRGWAYFAEELEVQRKFWRIGYIGNIRFLSNVIIRAAARLLMPSWLMTPVVNISLRHKKRRR